MLLFAALIAALSVAVLSSQFHDLRQQLTEEEWLTLIGQEETGALYDVVHPVLPSRHRRTPTTPHQLLLDAPVLQKQFTLDLQPATSLLDPRFALVSRWGNRSEQLPMDLVETDCYFTSEGEERAAVSVCGGVRGVIKPPGDEYYVINPLPKRFTKRSSDRSSSSPHVIVRKHISHFHTDLNRVRSSSLNSGDSFCGVRSEAVPIHNTGRVRRATISPVHVETAVFVDSDMFNLMSNNFPADTEREVVRFVLAMVNAVQLLYHDPSLGQPVTFVMKRLEILHTDPSGLVRYHDIDKFLGNFCAWQREENPVDDADPLHWDHALILTGLDLFVRSKNGKFSSQVVGLAPVAGMCTPTSSCTVNEGRHFESVYVVAHEIGHNLGMRHDGPLADNNCDPTSYLMSPTLGSGKITWSECSRHYLLQFLRSPQSHCLMDHNDQSQLDHSSHGALPGERFDADQQCMLKYGAGSRHASSQPLHDLCRDLHCHRDRYTWTSHPALEGTTCGTNKWCRSGRCVPRSLSQLQAGPVSGQWGPWGPYSECASGCLQGEPSGLGQGSTGIMFAYRQCNSPRPENGGSGCDGSDRKYRTCLTNQCENIPRTTVRDFADEVCLRARDVDSELVGTGLQKISTHSEEACTVWCYKRNGGSKSRGWTFPDGTACHTHPSKQAMYCISGVCQEFSCERGGEDSHMLLSSEMCQVSRGKRREVAVGVWQPISDCYYNCVSPGSGVRLVERRSCHQCNSTASIQLCKQDTMVCGKVKSTLEYATVICTQYSERVRRLSGMGMQLSPVVEDPDRACRIACQDETVLHRFYLVNGEDGWFPFGTDCTKGDTTKKAFCIRGKCLEFGSDDTPLHESEYILPSTARVPGRHRRSYDHSVTITATLDNQTLAEMVQYVNRTGGQATRFIANRTEVLDFNNPVVADISEWLKLNDVDSSFTL